MNKGLKNKGLGSWFCLAAALVALITGIVFLLTQATAAPLGHSGTMAGAVLLVGSLALLLFGLPLANIWVKLAAYIGVPVMMLSWAGCLIVFRRLRMSAAAYAQEKGKVLLP